VTVRAMIALVSEQRMQNILPCLQKGAGFAEVWLVRSREGDNPDSHLARARDNTARVLAPVAVHDAQPAVDAFAVGQVRDVVRGVAQTLAARGLQPVVNFTGGTKCMSVGAYLAAVEVGCIALYVDTQNERLLWYHPDGQVIVTPFSLERMSIDRYLRAYGMTVVREGAAEEIRRTEAVVDHIVTYWPRNRSLIDWWVEACRQSEERSRRSEDPGIRPPNMAQVFNGRLVDYLVRAGLMVRRGERLYPSPEGYQFFVRGRWLELVAFRLLRKAAEADGMVDELLWDVAVARLEDVDAGIPEQDRVLNELDVAVVTRGKLLVLECKSGSLRGEDALNKLQALQLRLGSFAQIYLVTSSPRGDIPESVLNRARAYRIRGLISGDEFSSLADLVLGRSAAVPGRS